MDSRIAGLDLKTSLSALVDLVLPRVCVVCGRPLLPGEKCICMSCLADFPQTHFAALSHNPMSDKFNAAVRGDRYEPYAYAAALFYYSEDNGYSSVTRALKYRRDFVTGEFFADLLGEQLRGSELFSDVDLVVPVPLHWRRRLSRGYNQAEVIARRVARALDVPCDGRLLRRCRGTASQTTLSGDDKRMNVAGAFRLDASRRGRLDGVEHLLLVDDVFTSGSTLASCSSAVREAVDRPQMRISVATLAFVGAV